MNHNENESHDVPVSRILVSSAIDYASTISPLNNILTLNNKQISYEDYLYYVGIDDVSCLNIPFRPLLAETETQSETDNLDNSVLKIVKTFIEYEDDVLEDELKCSICLGEIDKTWTVMSCLHRFCSECLHRCLRMELGPNKTVHECPSCRSKMASRRSSNPDWNYDYIISIVSPHSLNNSNKNDDDRVVSTIMSDPNNRHTHKLPPISRKRNLVALASSVTARDDDFTDVDIKIYQDLHNKNVQKFFDRRKLYKLQHEITTLKSSDATSNKRNTLTVTSSGITCLDLSRNIFIQFIYHVLGQNNESNSIIKRSTSTHSDNSPHSNTHDVTYSRNIHSDIFYAAGSNDVIAISLLPFKVSNYEVSISTFIGYFILFVSESYRN